MFSSVHIWSKLQRSRSSVLYDMFTTQFEAWISSNKPPYPLLSSIILGIRWAAHALTFGFWRITFGFRPISGSLFWVYPLFLGHYFTVSPVIPPALRSEASISSILQNFIKYYLEPYHLPQAPPGLFFLVNSLSPGLPWLHESLQTLFVVCVS